MLWGRPRQTGPHSLTFIDRALASPAYQSLTFIDRALGLASPAPKSLIFIDGPGPQPHHFYWPTPHFS